MNIHINHFSLGARNAFASAARLRAETGLSFWTGEWLRDISCHMFPLGRGANGHDVFIEMQCSVDAHGHLKDTRPNYRYDVLAVDNEFNGDYWTGLMLGVDSLADLEAIAKRLGADVTPEDSRTNPYNHFLRPDGYVLGYQSAPRWTMGRPDKWPMDMPGIYYYPDTPGRTSNQPVVAVPHMRKPAGVKSIVFGGTNEQLSDSMGQDAATSIPVRFNGQAVGLWEVSVAMADGQDVVIKRPAAASAIKDESSTVVRRDDGAVLIPVLAHRHATRALVETGLRLASRLLRSAIILPPAGAALVMAYAALHIRFPAADVSRLCIGIAAALLLVNLIAWVARDGHQFGREERLWAFLVFGAVVGGYYAGRQAIAEAEFDAIVHVQQRELVDTTLQLSNEIAAFVERRARIAPPRPGPLTWERDEAAWFAFEQQTVDLYSRRFSPRVRKARADFTFRSLRDRDLDAFYQSPMNAFQMRAVSERLAALAARLRRTDDAEK